MRGTSTLRNMGMSSTLYGPSGDPPPSPTEAYRATFDIFIDPTAGTSFADSSGNTQPAWATSWTASGDPTWTANGWVCDGAGDSWATSGNPGANLDGLTLFVAFTVDSGATGNNEAIMGCRQSYSGSAVGFDARQRSSDDVVQATVGDGSGNINDAIISPHTGGTFHSIALTFDQAGEDEVIVHGDGTVSGTHDTGSLGTVFDTGTPLSVARTNGGMYLNGTIHGFVVSSALDTAAIGGLHTYFAGVASA
jgi:hypothetical protein